MKQKQDPIFGRDVLKVIDKVAKEKLRPHVWLTDTEKYKAAPPELKKRMRGAVHQRTLRERHQIWNPDDL